MAAASSHTAVLPYVCKERVGVRAVQAAPFCLNQASIRAQPSFASAAL